MLQIRDLTLTALRKVKGSETRHTAGQLKGEGVIENLLRQDEGYRILKTLRSSPPYWQAREKDLFAMIRHLGEPTFFATFSAAETHWLDLLRVLYKLQHDEDKTDDELENLTWQEKSKLIQKDPVTCARHFDYRIQVLFSKVIFGPLQPLGEVKDYFYRVEYQQRGSPHIHCLFWVHGAPVADTDSDEEVVSFIDKHITCQRHKEGPLAAMSKLHEHKHSKSCKKGGKHLCRFGFPLIPMKETQIMRPLTPDEEELHKEDCKEHWQRIQDEVGKLKTEDVSFEEFLIRCGMTHEEYILAIRFALKHTKVFLQRSPSDTRMNSRNDSLAQIWMANTDVQFILDAYACAVYILTYISKSQRGMSDLLRSTSDEVKRGNHSVKEQVRIIANKFLNHCEISAQEAVYLLLQLPMCRSSRDVIFVNTSPPEERVVLLKSLSSLQVMDDDDTEVACKGLIDRYADRPKELENVCLAEFATSFETKKSNNYQKKAEAKKEFVPEGDDEEDVTDEISGRDNRSGETYELNDGKVLYRRRKPKVLRSVRYSVENDSEKHHRELLMLYLPWRNETTDLIACHGSYREHYQEKKELILKNSEPFMKRATEVDQAVEKVKLEGERPETWDQVAPQAQDLEGRQGQFNQESDTHAAFHPNAKHHKQYDIGMDLGSKGTTNITSESLLNRIPEEEYHALVRTLNEEQQAFFNHVLHLVKVGHALPFYYFLSGGAGVGKSRLVSAIYHALVRFLGSHAGENPDSTRVLLCAPTGKAAYNIRGVTLHTAFMMPASQSLSTYQKLDFSRLNSLRSSLAELKIVIIDEVSMVGAGMFSFIDNRLRDLMKVDRPFGGVSVLAVGDLFQLRPVMDRWVFEPSVGTYENLAPVLWQDLFRLYELKTVMRQRDDKIFAEALNRVREGKHIAEDEELFKSRVVKSVEPEVLHIFPSRRLVEHHNNLSLCRLPSTDIAVVSRDSVMGDIDGCLKEELLSKAQQLTPDKTQSLLHTLHLKVGARYMVVHNVDLGDGLINGASGTLKQVGHTGGECSDQVSVVWILFDDENVGVKARSDNRHLYSAISDIQKQWTPVFQAVKQFKIGRRENIAILRKQFPLTLCSAVTIHKAQGSTLEKVAVSFEGRTQDHLVYVALSRAKTLSGLHLLNFDPNKIKVSAQVKTEMERLRKEPLVPAIPNLGECASSSFVLVFHNTRSLHRHIGDLYTERNVLSAQVLFLFETWEDKKDEVDHYSLPGFKVLAKNTAPSSCHRPHAGSLVYLKETVDPCPSEISRNKNIELTKVDFSSVVEGLVVVGIYSPPHTTAADLLSELECVIQESLETHKFILIGGDFNADAYKQLPKPLDRLCKRFGLRQLISCVTTDHGSMLDLVFTNMPLSCVSSGVLECWYSDHKMCWAAIDQS
ncbi:uncharacterized protein [Littorina saxatilis]|uniref:uncharacterized protein n=1 Tax=Littorina saxatilis TaxID=31220 RepID=UPI0038B4C946